MTYLKRQRQISNLVYRMRKQGYEIDRKEFVAVMSEKRNKKLECRLIKFGFNVQYKMF